MAGVSRSATLVIAYLMKSRNIGLKEAYAIVKSKRKIVTFEFTQIHPNSSFLKQLENYEKQLQEPSKKRMDESTTSSWYSSTTPKKQIMKQSLTSNDYDRRLKG